MKLAVDMDGCLADFNTPFHARLVEKWGDRFPAGYDPAQPPCWEWPRHFGYTFDEEREIWGDVHRNDKFWQYLSEVPYGAVAVGMLDKLAFRGHDVYFVTQRDGTNAKQQTERWLEARGMYNPTVLICGDKIPVLKALKIDMFVDDRPETLIDAAKVGGLRTYAKLTSYNAGTKPWNVVGVKHVYEALERECEFRKILL